ncbi:MAG: DUF4857 domain-containing protein [Butyricimonas paravirosa]
MLLAVLVMALEFPKIYKKTFEQRERRTQLVFSEILNDFVTLKYEYDTVQLREIQVGRDRAGNTYDTKALMDIFPMKNCRQLMYENRFPDTIRGQHDLTDDTGCGTFPLVPWGWTRTKIFIVDVRIPYGSDKNGTS